jgi:hypothetical protein
MAMTSTTAGTTMAATAMPASISILPVCTTIIIIAPKGDEDQLYCTATGREASASLPQTDPS